jgi:hypothetical protein
MFMRKSFKEHRQRISDSDRDTLGGARCNLGQSIAIAVRQVFHSAAHSRCQRAIDCEALPALIEAIATLPMGRPRTGYAFSSRTMLLVIAGLF